MTEDQKYLVISVSKTTSGNNLFIKNMNNKNSEFIQITDEFQSNSYILHNINSKLYILTNLHAPNNKVITVDANSPKSNNWKDFIKETENVLSISKGGGYLFAKYFIDANSKIIQYDYKGNFIRNVEFKNEGNINGFSGKEDQKEIYYNFSNYITPNSSFKYNVEQGTS